MVVNIKYIRMLFPRSTIVSIPEHGYSDLRTQITGWKMAILSTSFSFYDLRIWHSSRYIQAYALAGYSS